MEAATKKIYNLVRVWMWEQVIEVLELLKRKFGNDRNFCPTARELPIKQISKRLEGANWLARHL